MRQAKYTVGDRVRPSTPRPPGLGIVGVFTITRVMPFNGTDFEYRAKGAVDGLERVFPEGGIIAVAE